MIEGDRIEGGNTNPLRAKIKSLSVKSVKEGREDKNEGVKEKLKAAIEFLKNTKKQMNMKFSRS